MGVVIAGRAAAACGAPLNPLRDMQACTVIVAAGQLPCLSGLKRAPLP